MQDIWQTLKSPIIGLAPMDGITDAAFRQVICHYGKPDIFITEFTSVEGICAGAKKLLNAFKYDEIEKPIIAQLFGTDPECFYRSALMACELGFDGIDINMGCPAKNICSKGAGAGLITNPKLAVKIIKKVKKAIKEWGKKKVGVSVKTRIGYYQNDVENWINILTEAKPDAISLHGRTFRQMYSGSADWNSIAKAAQIAHQNCIKLLGNGDITSIEDGKKKIDEYSVDGFLIGRATLGNPWIFSGICHPDIRMRIEAALLHTDLFCKIYPDVPFVHLRKHLAWYCKGFPNASEARQKLMLCNNRDQVKEILMELLKQPANILT